ncbi:MAG: matrixin family metalloprotease [Proteobacteria bacterium]|nr:MAG: matrixin family metalloprotease [Pseudomonadota bacterium]
MKSIFIALLGLTVAACGSGKRPQRKVIDTSDMPANYYATEGWASKTIELSVDMRATAKERLAIEKAVAVWNDAIGEELLQISEKDVSARTAKELYETLTDDFNSIYYEPNFTATTKKESSIIATTVWSLKADSSHIHAADIIMNTQGYEFVDYADPSESTDAPEGMSKVDAETVLIHELGHLLGLAHVSDTVDSLSVMNPHITVDTPSTKRLLSPCDIEHVKTLYKSLQPE